MVIRSCKPLKSNSFFLFGARGTGKSTLLRSHLGENVLFLDLLDDETFDRLLQQPKLLSDLAKGKKHEWIVIDEVQRLPKLLNLVHKAIEEHKQKFALSGSSSRKLKRGGANLLAGRAFLYSLFPFTYEETRDQFDLIKTLHWGALPKVFGLDDVAEKRAYLRAYCLTYIKEEIVAEQIVRNLEPFREFLSVAAQSSGKVINFSSIARDVGVQSPTVKTYFQILEETYMGIVLPHYHQSVRKSQTESPKFYFFDTGVKKALEGSLDSPPVLGTSQFGELFEAFLILEIHRLNLYYEKDFRLSFFRTKHGNEIDLVLTKGRAKILIEMKSTDRVDEVQARRLSRLANDFGPNVQSFLISQDPIEREIENVSCLNWQTFLQRFREL